MMRRLSMKWLVAAALAGRMAWPSQALAMEGISCRVTMRDGALSAAVSRATIASAMQSLAAATGAEILLDEGLGAMPLSVQFEGLNLRDAVQTLALGNNFAIEYRPPAAPKVWVFGNGARAAREELNLANAMPYDQGVPYDQGMMEAAPSPDAVLDYPIGGPAIE